MPSAAALAGLFPLAVAAYLCCYGPGHAWWRGRASGLPRGFARLAVSLLVTTLVALALVVLEAFSLPRLVAVCGALTLAGYLCVGRVRHVDRAATSSTGGHGGAVVFVTALMLYWPPFEAHLAASDASSYLAAGVQLTREHKLTKSDDLGPLVPPLARGSMFFSALGMPWKPPYSRVHGGMVVKAPGAGEASPSFFPLPSAWAAIFSDALGSRRGGGYAGLFSAAAVWAMWLLARARLGAFGALAVTGLIAANAAAYWAGRMPLAEPLAWFFAAAGLAALDAYEDEGFAADARLAGALLGAVALIRIEYAGFLVAALCARTALRSTLACRPLGAGFALFFVAMLAATALEATLVPGAYTAPLEDVLRGFEWITVRAAHDAPWLMIAAGAVASVLYALALRRLGLVRATAGAALVAFFAVYARFSPDAEMSQPLYWLREYLGTATLVLALFGAAVVWRRRFATPADGFLALLFAVVAACLIYDPHVYPAMPWASRRYVPVVIPLGLLFAGVACTRVWRRSIVAGLLAWVVLLASVTAPASASWRRGYFDGTYDQLRELVALLPSEGSLLLDNRLIPMMIGPPLWLAYGRNSLPASMTSVAGRNTVAGMTRILTDAGKGPVLLIRPTLTMGPEPIPLTRSTRIADFTLQIALPAQTDGPPPAHIENYAQSISIDRLDPVIFPSK